MIEENLKYDDKNQCWITSYPCLIDPHTLPNNYQTVYTTLQRTEKTLSKDEKWADTYRGQMQDMVERGVARKLSPQELTNWTGPAFYISHLAVVNPQSNSTPVRIVFNSSQTHEGVSLNSCLAKGPDSYMNNLIGILLRWREEKVATIGDIRKMFNAVHLKALEQHYHRFLWRNLEQHRPPDVYVSQRVNMGGKPAPAISTEAVYKTAELFREESPQAADLLKNSSYVDDLIEWQPNKSEAPYNVTEHSKQRVVMLKETDHNLRVLGLGWNPEDDSIIYEVTLNLATRNAVFVPIRTWLKRTYQVHYQIS